MTVGFASPLLRGHRQPTHEEKLASSQSDRVGQCRSQRSQVSPNVPVQARAACGASPWNRGLACIALPTRTVVNEADLRALTLPLVSSALPIDGNAQFASPSHVSRPQ